MEVKEMGSPHRGTKEMRDEMGDQTHSKANQQADNLAKTGIGREIELVHVWGDKSTRSAGMREEINS